MRERDRNRKLFHRGHYEVIAARFREEYSKYVDSDGTISTRVLDVEEACGAGSALEELMNNMADRFEFDNEDFDRTTFLERCTQVQNV